MASIAEILLAKAGERQDYSGQDIAGNVNRGLQTGAELAERAERLQAQKAALEQQKVQAEAEKWTKIGNWFDTASKMPEGAAKKAFTGQFITNGINALGMAEQFDATSLKMLQSDTTLAAYMKDQVAKGEMTMAQLTRAAKDPEYLATLMPDASRYQSYENYKASFEGNLAGIEEAGKEGRDRAAQEERARIMANSQEKAAKTTAGKEDWKREDALRSELTSNPISKSSYTVNEAYEKIKGIVYKPDGKKEAPSAAGDMSLVFAYMKMLDPGSTVREGEQAQARNATGVPDQIRNAYNKLIDGQTLNPRQRKDFVGQAEKIYNQQRTKQEKLNNQYKVIAKKAGVNPDVIVTGTEVPPEVKTKTFNVGGKNLDEATARAVLAERPTDTPDIKMKKAAKRKALGF